MSLLKYKMKTLADKQEEVELERVEAEEKEKRAKSRKKVEDAVVTRKKSVKKKK